MHVQKTGILERAPTPQEDIESMESLDLAPSVAAIANHVRLTTQAALKAGELLPYGGSRYKTTPHPWDRFAT